MVGVALLDGDDGHIVETGFHWQVHIDEFGNLGFNQWLENGADSTAQVSIFHRRNAYNGSRVNRLLALRDASHTEHRVIFNRSIVAGVVAKGAFGTRFGG